MKTLTNWPDKLDPGTCGEMEKRITFINDAKWITKKEEEEMGGKNLYKLYKNYCFW